MKIAFRNFLQTLRRYKTASLLNILGLTLAFTAFYVILVQVGWELGYNRSIADSDRIYLVENDDWYEVGKWSGWINRPISERAIETIADIEVGGCVWGGFSEQSVWTRNEKSFGYDKFTLGDGFISLPALDVFGFRSVEGNVHDLAKPNSVILSREAAARLGVGIGGLVWVETEEPKPGEALEVVALFEDFAENSLLRDCKVVRNIRDKYLDDPTQWSFNYYFKLRAGADPADVARQWVQIRDQMQRERNAELLAAGKESETADEYGARLTPLGNLYFQADSESVCDQGSAATTYTLLGIAVLVIVLAFINFVNFFFALVPVRLRTVNTFKVFGAPASSLRFSFVFEAWGLVVISLLLAWYIAFALQGSHFASYIRASLALSENLPVVLVLIGVAFAMTLAASLYPAWYITSFAPAMVIKGSFSGTRGGRRLRTALLGVQFFISAGLIIATGFIRLQHNFMMNYDMGFDKRNLLAVAVSEKAAKSYELLRGKILSDPRVVDVTGASSRLVSVNRMGWGRMFKGSSINYQAYVVQWNFLQMMGIRITEGRAFTQDDIRKEKGSLIYNEAARREFGISLTDLMNGFISDEPIVGFCADFNFQPLQYGVSPMAFYILPVEFWDKGWHAPTTIYVRLAPGADVAAVAEYLRECVASYDPHTEPGEIRIRNFDEELGEEYEAERKLTAIVGLFTLLSVAIALMGVFGIVLFETQHRRREIAIRRVMGASRGEVLTLFNRRYATLVVVSFLLAAPVSAWAVSRWLTGYAYHTPLSWWVFALALLGVLGVTVLTVTVRSWHAVNENPADSVKSE